MSNSIQFTGHEDKLMTLFGQLTAAVLQRGLEYSRRDDPHNYGLAQGLLEKSKGRFELRIDLGPSEAPLTTRGLIVDVDGEALMQVFEFVAELEGKTLHA